MAYLIRTSHGEIKTYMEISAGTVLEPGEMLEEIPLTLAQYSRRLRLSVDGKAGELVQVPASETCVSVDVECPGETRVALNINGLEETIQLVDGQGSLTLSCTVPGTFVVAPADRTQYCAAGQSVCIVEVLA